MVKKAISGPLLELADLLRKRRAELKPSFLAEDQIPTELSVPITAEIRKAGGYTWLQNQPSFVTAKETFENSLRQINGKPWGYSPGESDFTELVALFAGTHLRNLEWKPTGASAVLRQKAIDTAESLLELMSQGATLSNLMETESLKRSLETLISELPNTRKPDTGKSSAQRAVLTGFAASLLRRGLSRSRTVSVVEAIAPLFDFKLDRRTVQRYVRDAAEVTLR